MENWSFEVILAFTIVAIIILQLSVFLCVGTR